MCETHTRLCVFTEIQGMGFPGDSVVKNLPSDAADVGLIPVSKDPTCHRAAKPAHHSE